MKPSTKTLSEIHTKAYWDTVIDDKGYTNLHKIMRHFNTSEDQLDSILTLYKEALMMGANKNPTTNPQKNLQNDMRMCCYNKLIKAIHNGNNAHILDLMSTAPELCAQAPDEFMLDPLECAQEEKNRFAIIVIKNYLKNKKTLTKSAILDKIADLL